WNASPLHLLISTDRYAIYHTDADGFIESNEYRLLRKMFLDAGLDFSKETKTTQQAVNQFIKTFKEFESWLSEREKLAQVKDEFASGVQKTVLLQIDAEVNAFMRKCDTQAARIQFALREVFNFVHSLSAKAGTLVGNLSRAEAALNLPGL